MSRDIGLAAPYLGARYAVTANKLRETCGHMHSPYGVVDRMREEIIARCEHRDDAENVVTALNLLHKGEV